MVLGVVIIPSGAIVRAVSGTHSYSSDALLISLMKLNEVLGSWCLFTHMYTGKLMQMSSEIILIHFIIRLGVK